MSEVPSVTVPATPEEQRFIVLTLSYEGATAFTYLRNGQEDMRQIYFVKRIRLGAISQTTMLLGQFLFELEICPDDALPMAPGCTNRIYFPEDHRVKSFDALTLEEKEHAHQRLTTLREKYPKYASTITELDAQLS